MARAYTQIIHNNRSRTGHRANKSKCNANYGVFFWSAAQQQNGEQWAHWRDRVILGLARWISVTTANKALGACDLMVYAPVAKCYAGKLSTSHFFSFGDFLHFCRVKSFGLSVDLLKALKS